MAKTHLLLFVVLCSVCCVRGLIAPWFRGCGGDPNAKWTDNYMPLCEQSCALPDHEQCYYLSGRSGCTCKDGYYKNTAGQCVTIDQCDSDFNQPQGRDQYKIQFYYPPYTYNTYPLYQPYSPLWKLINQPFYQPTQPGYPVNVPFSQPTQPGFPSILPFNQLTQPSGLGDSSSNPTPGAARQVLNLGKKFVAGALPQ